MIETVKGKLVAKKVGIYLVYVFELGIDKYIMCTQLPNWDISQITIGDIGYITYEDAIAGDKYFDPKTGQFNIYNFTNTYIRDFVKDMEKKDIEIKII